MKGYIASIVGAVGITALLGGCPEKVNGQGVGSQEKSAELEPLSRIREGKIREIYDNSWQAKRMYEEFMGYHGGKRGRHIFDAYESTGDASIVIGAAAKLEERGELFEAFVLYDLLAEQKSMRRITAKRFLEVQERDDILDFMKARANQPIHHKFYDARQLGISVTVDDIINGVFPTPDKYEQRGDALLGESDLTQALRAYQEANSTLGMRKVAEKAEEAGHLDLAFNAYEEIIKNKENTAEDTRRALSVAESLFVTGESDWPLQKTMGITPTRELWNTRADALFQHGDLVRALDCYHKAGNEKAKTRCVDEIIARKRN